MSPATNTAKSELQPVSDVDKGTSRKIADLGGRTRGSTSHDFTWGWLQLHFGFTSPFDITYLTYFTSVSLRSHSGFTQIPRLFHFGYTYVYVSQRFHSESTSVPLRVDAGVVTFHLDSTPGSLPLQLVITSISLWRHMELASRSLRTHFGVPSGELRFQSDFASNPLRCHLAFTSSSFGFQFDLASMSIRFHIGFTCTPMSLRVQFEIMSVSLWCNVELTSSPLGAHLDYHLNTITLIIEQITKHYTNHAYWMMQTIGTFRLKKNLRTNANMMGHHGNQKRIPPKPCETGQETSPGDAPRNINS